MSDLVVRIGERIMTIGDVDKVARDPASVLLLNMAATIAAGIESATVNDENWFTENTVNRALDVATELLLAVRR